MVSEVRSGGSTATHAAEGDCPLCSVNLRERFREIEAEETGARFGVDECPCCGLGRTVPVPADLTPYYGASYYGGRHGLTAQLCLRRRLRIVDRIVGQGAEPSAEAGRWLLDYGCGDGSFLAEARARGWNGRGIERHGRESARDGLSVVSSLAELDEGLRFDCATLWHVLEHLEDPVGALADLRRWIRPGGVVLAAVPNFGSWQARATGASWLHLDIPRHLSHFTPNALAKTFEAAGFRVSETFHGEWEYDVIGWSQSLLNRWLGGRNEFFKAASGRPRETTGRFVGFQVVAGLALSGLAALPAWVESRIGRGGTLIVCARSGKGSTHDDV